MIITMSTRPKRTRKPKDNSEEFFYGTFSDSEAPKLYPVPKAPSNLIAITAYDDCDKTVFKQHCPLLTQQSSEKDGNIQQTTSGEHHQDSSPVDYGNQQTVEPSPGHSGDCSPEDYERQQSRDRLNNFSRDEYGNQQTAEQSSERRYNKSVAQIGS